jgi:N-acetylmuramic acid 6-phosphate etherase
MASKQPLDPRLTEQRNPLTAEIDRLSPLEIVDLINAEDQKVAPAVHVEREAIARAVELAEHTFREGGRLIYVGAGTSGRLGVLDASEMPPTFGTDPVMVQGIIAGGLEALTRALEGAEDRPEDGAAQMDAREVDGKDFVIGIATSGTTPFVHGALQRARVLGARTGFLLCTPPSAEHRQRYDVVIAPLVGPEVVTGSTRMKAGTATKLVLNMITTGAMIRLGKVFGNLMVDLRATNQKLQDRSERILMEVLEVSRPGARALLERAGGSVKIAIAMAWTDSDPQTARERLGEVGGRLTEVLDYGAAVHDT